MKRRTLQSLPNNRFNNTLFSEYMASHDFQKLAFNMGAMGTYNNQKSIDEYGGEPFYQSQGSHCFRGVNPHKKASIHPSITTKRVIYNSDGSGRDGYITQNNGGLSVDNYRAIHGTDVATNYSNSLRGYSKDQVNFGSNTKGGITARFADRFIDSKLAPEDPEFSKKNAKELAKISHRKQLMSLDETGEMGSSGITARQSLRTEVGSTRFMKPSETESLHLFRKNDDQLKVMKELLKIAPISKHDIYFRNQNKLMRNSILPSHERLKLN